MSATPPARKPAPAVQIASGQTSSGGAKGTSITVNQRTRLVAAIAAIDTNSRTPTQIRGIVGEYYKHVGRIASWPEFPVTLHPHPLHRDESDRPFTSIAAGICHYIGSTIKAYQNVTHLEKMTNLSEELVRQLGEAEVVLSRRLTLLEALAAKFPDLKADGDPATGYKLSAK
jgi:hypothetical protein